MKTAFLLTAIVSFASLSATGQNLSHPSVVQQGNEVLVSYQLDGEKGKAWSVSLYASHNNFSAPLKMVQGDVLDKRVLPGGTKQIRWRAQDELKTFDGDISFQIKVTPAPPLFTKIEASAEKVKRGKEVTISWVTTSNEAVKVELVKGDDHVPLGTGHNGKLAYSVPKKMKTGPYTISLSSAGEIVNGGSFKVMPKYPFGLKVLAIGVAGVGVWKIFDLLSGGDDTPEKLTGPPDLTAN